MLPSSWVVSGELWHLAGLAFLKLLVTGDLLGLMYYYILVQILQAPYLLIGERMIRKKFLVFLFLAGLFYTLYHIVKPYKSPRGSTHFCPWLIEMKASLSRVGMVPATLG